MTLTDDAPGPVPTRPPASDAASRRWRSVWRLHFYAGIFSMPFIVLMAFTGLVILYTQPLQDVTQSDLRTVRDRGAWMSFDTQEQAVEKEFPDVTVTSMTLPRDATHATIFGLDDGSSAGREAFVDPYTATVLGSDKTGGGVVGLSNRLHGFFDNNDVKVSLPSVAALWDHGAVLRKYVVGDLVLETFGVWLLALICSGLYLYWPRRSRAGHDTRVGRGLARVRLAKKGRGRWRDLHGIAGAGLFLGLLLTVVSGLAWSTYWGGNFKSLANSISADSAIDAPPSVLGTRGDLDRLGNHIPWNTGDTHLPASYAGATDGSTPQPLSLDAVTKIAATEHMKPGYSVYFPSITTDDAGAKVYGSFTVSNSWPRKTGEARDLFLDQFSGQTLASQKAYGNGAVSYAMDTLVSTHMGTQLGLFSRIVMTAVCVLALWSVVSGSVMYAKRRRRRSLGLPRRPVDVRLARGLAVFAVVLGIAFPEWGVTALAIVAFDKFVVRNVRPLRVAFGQR